MSSSNPLPEVVADGPLAEAIDELLRDHVVLRPWSLLSEEENSTIVGIYTYGHQSLDGAMMDRVPNVRVISNYGVGVDHICLQAAKDRGIPVGNTPGILNGATADMAFCLLLATARRLAEGDRYARSPKFTRYDPGFMLGQEVHGTTLGIIGMGRIGEQIARRALGFDMRVIYHNRSRRLAAEDSLGVTYVSFDQLLQTADHVMLCVPLSDETHNLIGARELALMKSTATLTNIARGAVVDTPALTAALTQRRIYAAGLDVTDPEPLPRDHPLLRLENVVISPHLGSATEQTRQRMAEVSCQNLLDGIRGNPLSSRVV